MNYGTVVNGYILDSCIKYYFYLKHINFKNRKLWVEAKLILIEKHEFECEEPDLI